MSNSSLSPVRLEVDFVLPLSQQQQQQEQEQEEPPTKYLSCYWPDFDQTLNVGTWEPLEQIPTVTVTFVNATFVLVTYISISGISQMLLARFWPNFKGRFLGRSLTDANCYGDIWQGNICPGNICPYQQYLNCYWSDFDQIFWHNFGGLNFCRPHSFWTKLFWTKEFFIPKSFWPKFFLTRFFLTYPVIFLLPIFT